MRSRVASIALLSFLPTLAWAQDAADICTDRPSRAAAACTVPSGVFQYEADLGSGTFQRSHGVTTDTGVILNPALKYGLTRSSDLELQWSPFAFQRTHAAGGKDATAFGPSDLTLRFKQNVFGGNDGAVSVALVPYLTAPTASHLLGDGVFDGGIYAPLTFKLGPVWSLSLTPELDVVRDDEGGGRHLQHSQVVSVTRTVAKTWVLFADIYGQWDFERHGPTQTTLDFAVAKILHHDLQLDAGVNLGLNRATPGATTYVGVSQRF